MSCYRDGDLLSYRVPKRRGGKGHHTFTGTVQGNHHEDTVLVWNKALSVHDHVPVETIVMHQPQLSAA